MFMSRIFEVITPEHVAIRYELAGIGSRGVAVMVDMLLQILLFMAPVYGITQLRNIFTSELAHSILTGLLILSFFIILWAYFVIFETLWNGETPGKRLMGLRVIKDAGYPVDFAAVVMRNFLRAIDFLPSFYAVGFIVQLCSKQYKRLGDYPAGTVVVRHGRADNALQPVGGAAVVFRLLDAGVISQITRLTRVEYRTVQHFLERRNELPAPLRMEFARRLAQSLIEKFGYQVPAFGMDYLRWLEELDLAYRRCTLGTAPVASAPSAPPVPAPATDLTPPAEASPTPVDTRKW